MNKDLIRRKTLHINDSRKDICKGLSKAYQNLSTKTLLVVEETRAAFGGATIDAMFHAPAILSINTKFGILNFDVNRLYKKSEK